MKTNFPVSAPRRRQSGITLAIMLVMLVIISLTSVAVIRGSISADRVSNNLRQQTSANQAAQMALRYCESQIGLAPPGVPIQDAPVSPARPAWETFANWLPGSTMVAVVPESHLPSTDVAVRPGKVPQCLAERSNVGAGAAAGEAIIVTARGFSPDYTEDEDTGISKSGSVVWLQSAVTMVPVPAASAPAGP